MEVREGVNWVGSHPHFRKILKGDYARFWQHGHEIAEMKVGRHRRLWHDLFALSMSPHERHITASVLVVLILFSLFLQFPEL